MRYRTQGMTMRTPAGPVDLVPLFRRLDGDMGVRVLDDERDAAVLALTHLGLSVQRIAGVLNLHAERAREVLAEHGVTEVAAAETISWTGVAYTPAAQRNKKRRDQRRAKRIEVDGRLIHPDAPHGTDYGFTDFGCHCKPCQLAHAAALTESRQRKAAA